MLKINKLINSELQDEFIEGSDLSGDNTSKEVKEVIELDGEYYEQIYKLRKTCDSFNEKYNLNTTRNLSDSKKRNSSYWNLDKINAEDIKNKDYNKLLLMFLEILKYGNNDEYKDWNKEILEKNNIEDLLNKFNKTQKKSLVGTIYGNSIGKLLQNKYTVNDDDVIVIDSFVARFNTKSIFSQNIETVLDIVKNIPSRGNKDFENYINKLNENGVIILKGRYDNNESFQYGNQHLHFQDYETRISKMQDLLKLGQDEIVKYFFNKKPNGKIHHIDSIMFGNMISSGLTYGTKYSKNHIFSLNKDEDFNENYSKKQINEQIELIEDIIEKIKEMINYDINMSEKSKVSLYEYMFRFMKVDEEIKNYIKTNYIDLTSKK